MDDSDRQVASGEAATYDKSSLSSIFLPSLSGSDIMLAGYTIKLYETNSVAGRQLNCTWK